MSIFYESELSKVIFGKLLRCIFWIDLLTLELNPS